jgi:serine/threonine protein kinase
MRDTSKALEVGDLLDGDRATYRVTSLLSEEGAHGKTYTALVETLRVSPNPADTSQPLQVGLQVVIKVPPGLDDTTYTYADMRDFLSRVNQALDGEFRLFTRLRGVRSAASVYDIGPFYVRIGDTDERSCFLVSEYVQGQRLDKWRREPQREPFSAEDFFKWARSLAEALSEIHQAGIVHGDIWPKNIIIRNDAKPIFIDFGQAVIRAELTRPDKSERSHVYMAPEDERTVYADMYSLCATLFYLAVAQDPQKLRGDKENVKQAVIDGLRKWNLGLYQENCGIADIIARGLRTKGHDRTPETERLVQDIDLFDPITTSVDKKLHILLGGIHGKVLELEGAEPIFGRMVGTRLRQLDRYIDLMVQGILDVTGDHETLVMTLAQYLSVCEAGDQYLTASVPRLWYEKNMGVKGRLRSINKQIAKRGTTLRRVFVVTSQELNKAETRWVLEAHAEMLNEIDQEARTVPVDTKSKQLDAGGIYTGVLELDAAERDRRFTNNPHSGIWIRGSKVVALLPFYDEESQDSTIMTGVRLRPGDGKPEALRHAFNRDYLNEALEIREFLRSNKSKIKVNKER